MADRLNYYFRQPVTEAELDLGFSTLEQADFDQAIDNALVGLMKGGVLTEAGVPNLTVLCSGPGVAYDKTGKRIAWASQQTIDVSADENAVSTSVAGAPNSKIISVFAKFIRVLTDPRVDGNSVTVYFSEEESFAFIVRQSAEAVTPTPPSLDGVFILLGDLTRAFGQTTIVNANISITRREDAFVGTGATYTLRAGTPLAAVLSLLANLNSHLAGTEKHLAAHVTYATSGNWADATALTSTDVEAALDEVVSDLAGTAGTAKVGGAAYTPGAGLLTLAAGSAQAQLRKIFDYIDDHYVKTFYINHADDGSEPTLFTVNGTSFAVQESVSLGGLKANDLVLVDFSYYARVGAGEGGDLEIRITENGTSQYNTIIPVNELGAAQPVARKAGGFTHLVQGATPTVVVEVRAKVDNGAHTMLIKADAFLRAHVKRGANY